MSRAFATLLLAAATLATGCVTPPAADEALGTASVFAPSRARLACFSEQVKEGSSGCNFEATTTNTEGNEVTVAVNPKDPLNIVAAAKDYTPRTAGDCVWVGVYVTKDGGKTWTNSNVPGSPHLLKSDPTAFRPTFLSQFWCTTDPVLAFGADGTCYLVVMAYQADPVSSSKLGRGTLKDGGLNDWLFNRAAQVVLRSEDGCLTFPQMSAVADGSYPVNFHDKAWLTVGNDGTVHIGWLTFGGFLWGYADDEVGRLLPTGHGMLTNQYYRSIDGGKTWEGPQVLAVDVGVTDLAGPAPGQGTMIATGNGGKDVYVAWDANTELVMAKSTDGGKTFSAVRPIFPVEDGGMRATYRSGGMPFMVADDADASPHKGRLSIVWQDTRNGDRDILFATSVDGGETWSDHVRLNDDPLGNRADQFFPALSVGPDGVLDVVWYDRRDDPKAHHLHLYYTYSTDGGATWAANVRVTETSTDPDDSHHQNGMIFIGDYIDIDSSAGAAHAVWVDTRYGVADVFVGTLLRGDLGDEAVPPSARATPPPSDPEASR